MRGVEEFNGYVCADGARAPFSLEVSDALRVEDIPYANHPAYARHKNHKRVVAARDIKRGEILGYYAGQLVPITELDDSWKPYMYSLPSADYHVNAQHIGNAFRYVNDYRDMDFVKSHNLIAEEVLLESGLYAIRFKAKRALKQGTELLLNYGQEYWDYYEKQRQAQYCHTCELCDYVTDKISLLRQHRKKTHKPQNRKCRFCDFTTKYQYNLKDHENVHLGVKPHVCTVDACGARYTHRSSLVEHTQKVHTLTHPVYKCTVCEKTYKKKWDYHRHVSRPNVHAKESPKKRTYKCDFCDMSCARIALLRKHVLKQHATEEWFACTKCNHKAWSARALQKHEYAVHRENPARACTYSECTYTTKSQEKLNLHVATVHTKKIFRTCTQCHYDAYTKQQYARHIACVHAKPIKCNTCDVESKNSRDAWQHKRSLAHLMRTNQPIPPERYCETCNVYLEKTPMRDHLKTKRHLAGKRAKNAQLTEYVEKMKL